MKFLCIVPIFNEESKLKDLINKIKSTKNDLNDVDFLLINNGSTDNSSNLIYSSNINFISFEKNYGVGFALIQGLKYALKNQYKFLVHLAGNGKMDPAEIINFKNKILNEKFNFVSGSRFLPNGNYSSNPISRIIMIKILSFFISLLYRKKITDATCGYRAFDIELFRKQIELFENKKFYKYRYEYYSIGKVLLNKKVKFTEIPVSMNYSKKNYSKIRPIIDWFLILSGWIEALIDGKRL